MLTTEEVLAIRLKRYKGRTYYPHEIFTDEQEAKASLKDLRKLGWKVKMWPWQDGETTKWVTYFEELGC